MTIPKKKLNGKPLPSEAKSPKSEPDRRLRQADRLARVMRMLQLCVTGLAPSLMSSPGPVVMAAAVAWPMASSSVTFIDGKLKENPSWSRAELRDKLQTLLQVDQLIVIPKEPLDPIGHSDAVVRFIDEQTVLVNEYSKVDPDYGERLFKVLRRHKLATEIIPYHPEEQSRGGIPSAVGNFTNFLRTEKVLIAPVYRTDQDDIALRKLGSVFPGLSIVPLDSTDLAREGGVLNCVSASYRLT